MSSFDFKAITRSFGLAAISTERTKQALRNLANVMPAYSPEKFYASLPKHIARHIEKEFANRCYYGPPPDEVEVSNYDHVRVRIRDQWIDLGYALERAERSDLGYYEPDVWLDLHTDPFSDETLCRCGEPENSVEHHPHYGNHAFTPFGRIEYDPYAAS